MIAISPDISLFNLLQSSGDRIPFTTNEEATKVLISRHNEDEFVGLEGLETRALWAHELSDRALAELKDARVDPRHDHLNALMDTERE